MNVAGGITVYEGKDLAADFKLLLLIPLELCANNPASYAG